MMLGHMGLGRLASALLLCGCAGDELSLGELRCEGDGVQCKRPETVLPISPELHDRDDNLVGLDGRSPNAIEEESPELAVDALWTVDLPCPNDGCALRRTDVVTHPDGALTVARIIQPMLPPFGLPGPYHHGVWLGHFDADGELLWQDDSLIDTIEDNEYRAIEAALALDQDGQVLLGLLRVRVIGDADMPSYERKTTVYRVSDAGEIDRLFRIDDLSELSAVAEVDGDVLILGHGETSGTSQDAELARYEPNGTLVWRQTALHEHTPGTYDEALFTLDMPMLTDDEGRAVLATLASATIAPGPDVHRVYDAVQVGPDGNIRWVAGNYTVPFTEPEREPGSPRLARDTLGRLVLAQGAYQVTRFEVQGSMVQSAILALRAREEFWNPVVMGLACNASDRVLVVTQSGAKTERRLLIDRISEDFSRRETFVLPQSFALSSDLPDTHISDPYEILSNTGGIAVGLDDTVVVWTNSAIARIALP